MGNHSAFQRLYGAQPFDPNDRLDRIAEAARKTLIRTAIETEATMAVEGGPDLPALLGGLLVGLVQVVQATTFASDQRDAAIRTSIMQLAAWAVDAARSAEGKEPLANG